jgi:DNA polymerase I
MLDISMIRVEEIPLAKKVETLDMYELLNHYSYETTYKGSIKKSELRKDDDHVWFNWTVREEPVKLKRFIENCTPEFEALCRILGAYIAEGSNSTIETTARKGASISSSDKTWLEKLQKDYYLLFSGTTASIIKSNQGIRKLTYNNDRGEVTILLNDHTHKLQMMNQMAAVFFKGLCGQKSKGKRLPDFIFHVEDRYKKNMLEEMIKGDGSRVTNNNLPYSDEYKKSFFKYETKSLQLACGISLLLNQLNEKYAIRYREEKRTYSITRTHDHYNKILRSKIKEEEYDGYVYDLSVEGTHAFVDSCGQILLHNTDSLFVQSPYTNLEETVRFGKDISERFSREISQMEFQKVLEPLFSHGKKKRYVGRSVWPDQELLVRGYETRRVFFLRKSMRMYWPRVMVLVK